MSDRILSYAEAINQSLTQAMTQDPNILVLGIDADDPKKLLQTTAGLSDKFGKDRCFSTPLAEEGMTGIAIGMSLAGIRPILCHIRQDFIPVAMNQLMNHLTKIHYMYGGAVQCPVVIKSVIGKSWGQGSQHSAAYLSLLASLPGLKVLAPALPYDAAACYAWALQQSSPAIICEHRMCYYQTGPVPSDPVFKPYRVLRPGTAGTFICTSFMTIEALRAATYLEKETGDQYGVINVIDLSNMDWLKDLTVERNFIIHNDYTESYLSYKWAYAILNQTGKRPVIIGWPFCPCPTTPALEKEFYTDSIKIVQTVWGDPTWQPRAKIEIEEKSFTGPF